MLARYTARYYQGTYLVLNMVEQVTHGIHILHV